MKRLYQSLLDDDDELFNTTKYNIFKLLNVYKIYILGPDELTNEDIHIMMEFLNYVDWDKIKNEGFYINYKQMPAPIYNGFTKEYRDKINILSYLICELAVSNNFDTFTITKKLKNYLLSDYKLKYILKVKYYKSNLKEKVLGIYLEEKNKYTKGIEIMFKE